MIEREAKQPFLPHFAGVLPVNTEVTVRPPLQMSNSELLRFGMALEFKCSPQAHTEDSQREECLMMLQEVRKEWLKRFPRLPLSATFDDQDPSPEAVAVRHEPSRMRRKAANRGRPNGFNNGRGRGSR